MVAPSYRDIPSAVIPEFTTDEGVLVRVIGGVSHGVAGAVQRPDTEPLYLDVHIPAGGSFEQPINPGHNAFVYVYRGSVDIAGTAVADRNMAILANDGAASVSIKAPEDARLMVVAGQPLNEPIVQHGPFVMNTTEQIQQTLRDYRDGAFDAASVQSL
jgi:quercetin 2,3-dioxygenase